MRPRPLRSKLVRLAWLALLALACAGTPKSGTRPAPRPPEPERAPVPRLGTGADSGWILLPAGEFVMGSPGPECAPGCVCGQAPGQCRDPRCESSGCPGAELGRTSEEGQRTVRIEGAFWIMATEVTRAQYRRLTQTDPSRFASCGDACPVERVSWFEALVYANALSIERGLPPCYLDARGEAYSAGHLESGAEPLWPEGHRCLGFRLPTEAEWEYAARAGTATAVFTGELTVRGSQVGPELDPIAWYRGNSGVDWQGAHDCTAWRAAQLHPASGCGPHPVAGKRPNAWGLYDTSGNVSEWIWDSRRTCIELYGDPGSCLAQVTRVVRGGGWGASGQRCRAANRSGMNPASHVEDIGFRLVRSAPPTGSMPR